MQIKTKEEINALKEQAYVVPTTSGDMEYLFGETLMLFGWQSYRKKKYRPFYGIGIVYRVVKGTTQDLIYIRFGNFPSIKTRLVVAFENHARRQIMTLKRGQCCQVYGVCRYFTDDIMLNGKPTNGIRLGLYAKAILGWYVPTMFDIRKMPINEDLVEPTPKEQEIQQTFSEVLDEFINGNGEEE